METIISTALQESIKELYNEDISIDKSYIQRTRRDIHGDFTVVIFPFLKIAKKAPDAAAAEIGESLSSKLGCHYQVIKGFINLTFADLQWLQFLHKNWKNDQYGYLPQKNRAPILIEYSSPNTNKPLHLGHIRNNLLGSSISRILKACGEQTICVNLVNDRGIHICKSMLAWQKFGNGETPETSNLKGDHLVGKYYVIFDQEYKKQIKILVEQGISEEEAGKKAPILLEAQEMLRRWEEGDTDIISIWKMMNEWVYKGFEITYQELGIHFDKTYYESETYLLGKQLVEEGLHQGAFYRKEDGSVWVNLNDEGMDEKLLLRQDGTSVYMTQDLGTASLRFEEFHPEKMIYVVGNEQNYHFDVLKIILSKKLNKSFGNHIHHLSYGMVELPSGKMKSREGTVVDADNLMEDMIVAARRNTQELGKTDFSDEEAEYLHRMIGLGALKYFILKVDPKKNMLFNPEESIDLNGNTAPFIQYTYARIRSLLRKADKEGISLSLAAPAELTIPEMEKELIKSLYDFPQIIENAGTTYSPAIIANYMFDVAKAFNRFYQETPIFKETSIELKIFRLQISHFISNVLRNGMALLGIDLPEKM